MNIHQLLTPDAQSKFQDRILRDLAAFEDLLATGRVATESGVHVGIEQELQFVDGDWRPACVGSDLAEALDDPAFTEEFAQFNFEMALPPRKFGPDVLRDYADEIAERLATISRALRPLGATPVICGILPSLSLEDITRDVLTNKHRYKMLFDLRHEAEAESRNVYRIDGIDGLVLRDAEHVVDGVLTSLQLHWQVSPETAAAEYNWSQLIAAPCVAAACCSPIFLGRRLWHETRIPLFEQATDIRYKERGPLRQRPQRASFGEGWVKGMLDIWRSDLAAYEPILGHDVPDGETDGASGVPTLPALQFFNSTVYRWNRLCYGVGPGAGASVRIESRALPAGLTIQDEVANMALWWGLMDAGAEYGQGLPDKLDFSRVRENFGRAAREGMECQAFWLDGKTHAMHDILIKELVPLAARHLKARGIEDADSLLSPVVQRAETRQTASRWMLDSFDKVRESLDVPRASTFITEAVADLAASGMAVHEWPVCRAPAASPRQRATANRAAPLRLSDSLDLARERFAWEDVDSLSVEGPQGAAAEVTAQTIALARSRGLEKVADLFPYSETTSPSGPTVKAFDHEVPLRRIVFERHAKETGPLFVLMGGLHGNEMNGVAALHELSQKLRLRRGSFIGMLGNLPALRKNTRYIDRDLNRSFLDERMSAETSEAGEVRDIVTALDRLAAEAGHDDIWLLDLHGTSGHAPPYLSLLTDTDTWPLRDGLPVPKVAGAETMFPGTMVEYMINRGWKSVTYESGAFAAPISVSNGVALVELMLRQLDMTDLDDSACERYADTLAAQVPTQADCRFIYRHRITPEDRFEMLPGFVSFQEIHEGEKLGKDCKGDVLSPYSGRILMPLYQTQGESGFYIVE